MTETNINWNPKIKQMAASLAQRHVQSCHIQTLSKYYQPGETATAVLGNLTGRINTSINDKSGMEQ
jgi:hypothetical protein